MGEISSPPGETETVVDKPRGRERPAREPPAAQRLGHFQLLDLLGEGGMGSVFSAYDLHLDRKVAIKLLPNDASSSDEDRERQQRLLREAQAMAKLSHPNVVPVYEVGVDSDTVFIAMEYVAGQTLREWLKQAPRTWREIVGVFVQAGRGLAAAHDAGIVHRDFKPANVLIDARGHVRVADFGIAQVRGMPETEVVTPTPRKIDLGEGGELTNPTPSTPLTEQGSIVGTPAYMSPEQYRSAAVDPRSDQFSFCVTLYEALYGKRPFAGRGKTLAENVTKGSIDKPDAASKVPGRVTAILLRGLATDPDQRYPAMAALCDALARDPSRIRRRIALGAFATITVAGVAAVAGSRLAGHRDTACAGAETHLAGVWDGTVRDAVASRFTATGVPYAAASATRVITLLDGYRDGWVAMRTEACRATRVRGDQSERVLDLRMACLDRRLGELRALTTEFTGQVDAKLVEKAVGASSALGSLETCADTAALVDPDATPADPAERSRRAELRGRLDHLNADMRVGRVKDAVAPASALVSDVRATADGRLLAEALALQGSLEAEAGDLKASEATLADAVRRARQLGDLDLFVATSTDLVSTLAEGGLSKAREALGMIRLVEAIVEDTHDPELAIRLSAEKADEDMMLAHPELAVPILEAAIDRTKRTLGDDHVMLLRLQSLYGSALDHLGKYTESLAVHDALISSASRMLGALHPTTLLARLSQCRAFADNHDVDRGISCFALVMPDATRVLGISSRQLLHFRSLYGLALASRHRLEEARQVYASALADVPADAWDDKFFTASDIARQLGRIEVELGDYTSALAHCEKAEATTEQKHAGIVGPTCIGEALLGLGDPTRALAVLEPVRARLEGIDPSQMGIAQDQIGEWRFAYARASWAMRHQAKEARDLARTARGELGEGPARDQLDAWLAKLPP